MPVQRLGPASVAGAVDIVCEGPLNMLSPTALPLSGSVLAAALAIAESSIGPSVTHVLGKATLGGMYQVCTVAGFFCI
jgi:hypothetical protein